MTDKFKQDLKELILGLTFGIGLLILGFKGTEWASRAPFRTEYYLINRPEPYYVFTVLEDYYIDSVFVRTTGLKGDLWLGLGTNKEATNILCKYATGDSTMFYFDNFKVPQDTVAFFSHGSAGRIDWLPVLIFGHTETGYPKQYSFIVVPDERRVKNESL